MFSHKSTHKSTRKSTHQHLFLSLLFTTELLSAGCNLFDPPPANPLPTCAIDNGLCGDPRFVQCLEDTQVDTQVDTQTDTRADTPQNTRPICLDIDECSGADARNPCADTPETPVCVNFFHGFRCDACPFAHIPDGSGGCIAVAQCDDDNGGCGDADFIRCVQEFDDNENIIGAECIDIAECAVNNGACGDAQFSHCLEQEAAKPICDHALDVPQWPMPAGVLRDAAEIAAQYQDDGDTFTDRTTQLMWITNPIQTTFVGAIEYCDELDTGGYDDWRLPTRMEASSLIQYVPDIDASLFPFARYFVQTLWTSSVQPAFLGDPRPLVWLVDIESIVKMLPTPQDIPAPQTAACVRFADPVADILEDLLFPEDRFFVQSNGNDPDTVRDRATGQRWLREPITFGNQPTSREQCAAICDSLVVGNFDDWRVPSIAEVLTISDPHSPTSAFYPEFLVSPDTSFIYADTHFINPQSNTGETFWLFNVPNASPDERPRLELGTDLLCVHD